MSIRRADVVRGEPSDKRDPNAVAASLAYYEEYGPQLLSQRVGHLRDIQNKYKGILSDEKISRILSVLRLLQERHSETGYSSVSRDAELVFWQTAHSYQWMGENVRVLGTSDYDDRRGVADYYLQTVDPKQPENNFDLYIDITVGTGGKGKLTAKEVPFAKIGSLDDLQRSDPDRAELFELDGVRRKALLLQLEQQDIFPAYSGYTITGENTYEVGIKAPAIVVSLSENEIDSFLKSLYSSEEKRLLDSAKTGEGLETSSFRKHILERILSGIKRQIIHLKDNKERLYAKHPDEFLQTNAALQRAETYFLKLLNEVKRGVKHSERKKSKVLESSPVRQLEHAVPPVTGRGEERPALSFEQFSRITEEAHKTAQRALAIRERISAIREQTSKLSQSITSAQKATRRLEAIPPPISGDSQRTGAFLIERGFLWEDVAQNDRARMRQIFIEQMASIRDAVSILSGIEAPSTEEKRRLAEYQKTLAGVDALTALSFDEYQRTWQTKRDTMLQRIRARATDRANRLKDIVLESLKDPEILTRLQESHAGLLGKIEQAAPGVVAQAQERINASIRSKEHARDFLEQIVERIATPDGGIETYLALQNEIFGKIEYVIEKAKQHSLEDEGQEQDSELWDAVEEYGQNKQITSKRIVDLQLKLLDIIAQEQAAQASAQQGTQSLQNYLRIIQRMDYISFLATIQAFITNLDSKGLFDKVVPDQHQRRKIVSKVTAFIDNHDVLEALTGDILAVTFE